jgi:hypothetical protein
LTKQEIAEIDRLIANDIWLPLPGPQTWALESEADELFYGGSAGGGKTDLLLGAALTRHRKSIIFRREATQLEGILDRLHGEILRSKDGFNGQTNVQKLPGGKRLEFGSCPHVGNEMRYQGRPHDLKGFDEITHFMKVQYTFLCGWMRTTTKGQRCRIIATGNPPTDSDGEWVIAHWGAWLDELHPDPAKPGELRWYAMIDGVETQVKDSSIITHGREIITPKSRTFIPSSIQDNPFLMETGYMSTLQALPEPLRSQMLFGDFKAGLGDDPWQVLPTAWVKAAQDRWSKDGKKGPMDSIGMDCARGGADKTIISRRYGVWFDELLTYPGAATPDGPSASALAITAMRDAAPIHVDIIGIGSSVYDHLKGNNVHTVGVNGSEKSEELDKTGKLKFRNLRAQIYWRMREALDPKNDVGIALPPDAELRADLCAPRWKLSAAGIQIEGKEDLIKRIGRSPDKGDAVVYAHMATLKKSGAYQPPRAMKVRRK